MMPPRELPSNWLTPGSMSKINVTKTFLPPIKEYEQYLERIWESGHLTNQGPLLIDFEQRLERYLNVENLQFVNNGTVALQVALNTLGITEGEVITTPFSYVATTSAILWERCNPVFVDIERDSFCIDANRIEAAITDKTIAILAVHVFGYPCDTDVIDAIGVKYNLKVIYDGAHAFGAKLNGQSLLSYGDISTCSFHATKLFHTIEGGCIVSRTKKTASRVELVKRFGHNTDDHFMLGINAKATEFQAAMGLCNLNYVDELIDRRKEISGLYENWLGHLYQRPKTHATQFEHNYSYYPIVFSDEDKLQKAVVELNTENIFPRRYFFPSLNQLPYVKSSNACPVSEQISRTILCLPLYPGLEASDVDRICQILIRCHAA